MLQKQNGSLELLPEPSSCFRAILSPASNHTHFQPEYSPVQIDIDF